MITFGAIYFRTEKPKENSPKECKYSRRAIVNGGFTRSRLWLLRIAGIGNVMKNAGSFAVTSTSTRIDMNFFDNSICQRPLMRDGR